MGSVSLAPQPTLAPPLKAEHRPAAQEVVREQPAVLEDLVAMCNLAARHGCGSVVWLTWRGTNKRKVEPGGFTGCVGYTKDGARALLERLGERWVMTTSS